MKTAVQLAGAYMEAHLDALVERITAQVWQAVPSYGDILIQRQALELQVRPNIVDAVNYMLLGKDLDDEDRLRLHELGRSRALQGIPLAAMIQSFRIAERALVDEYCVFCIKSAFDSAKQRSGILAISAIMDKLEITTIDSYREMQRQLDQDHQSSLSALVGRLVNGTGDDRVHIDAQARLVGADPAVPYRCVAFSLSPLPGNVSAALAQLRRHLLTRLIEARITVAVAGELDHFLLLLLPSSDDDVLTSITRAIDPRQHRMPVLAGAGDVYPSLFAARASCREAIATLDVALRQHRTHEVVRYPDVVVDVMLLGDRNVSRRLIKNHLDPINDQPALIETLRVYVECSLSAQATADRLMVHVNTIGYRLKRVRELTGYDVRNFADAVGLSLALRARDILS